MRRRWWLGAGAAALAGGAAVRLAMEASSPPDVALDDAFWRLRLRSAAGGEIDMAGYRGRRLVLNFWATWCAPCVREMPLLSRFQREHGPQGWQVLGLAIDAIAPVLVFSQKLPVSFPLLVADAEGMQLSRRWGNPGGLPFTAVFDVQGRLRSRKVGECHAEDLQGWLRAVP